ncbi:MAG: hypothetical protein HY040_00790 [Planctomycetes bacterium]|nr:hypothetical protein [Planctomycetota bacterium]
MLRAGLLICALFVATELSYGGPEMGARAGTYDVGADPWEATIRFKASERASVFAKGKLTKDGNDATGSLLIEVHDADGKLVASSHDTLGYAVVFWYPPRSGEYKIQVHNNSGQTKRIYLCIK